MNRALRTFAVLLFVFSVAAARPALAGPPPLCFSNLPQHNAPDPTWTYSHQCRDLQNGTTIWYVYIAPNGSWHLCSGTTPP